MRTVPAVVTPSPWLAQQQRYEREARHARNRAKVWRIAKPAAFGATAAAAFVLALQWTGVLPV